jgi:transglutaminase-like putative cysteine protease
MRLAIRHDTSYRYSAPVSLAHHVAHLQPLQDSHQRLLQHGVDIDPEGASVHRGQDAFGNAVQWFTLQAQHDALRVRASSLVEVRARHGVVDPTASAAWDDRVAALAYRAGAPYLAQVEFAQPSPFVPRLAALGDYARVSFPRGRPLVAAALDLMQRLHTDFDYQPAATQVDTPLAESFAQRRGVCQDFAHLLCGGLRMLGLPARYVSGYLLTRPPGGAADLLGADASHAWVQVWVGEAVGVAADGWLDLDPTNAMIPGETHVRLAIGRDYGDVAPLRGVILGGGRHALSVAVSTTLIAAGPELASESREETLGP